jgi:hypothetical protein
MSSSENAGLHDRPTAPTIAETDGPASREIGRFNGAIGQNTSYCSTAHV